MITEDYVSFETAKLLKEKGFDESTSMVYMSYGDLCKLHRYDSIRNSNYNDITKNYFEYTAPTLQMTCKWLRETYHLHILFEISDPSQINPKYYFIVWDTSKQNSYLVDLFDSYEEACEEAIKYCLENLVKV